MNTGTSLLAVNCLDFTDTDFMGSIVCQGTVDPSLPSNNQSDDYFISK